MGFGAIAVAGALRIPLLAKGILWGATRYYAARRQNFHWVLGAIAHRIDYRSPMHAQLSNGMRIQVPWSDVAGRAIYETGSYEPETVRALSSLLKPGMIFLDIGAAFGQFTLVASPLVGGQGHVYAFEPEPTSFAWLRENVTQNRLANVTISPTALGDGTGHQALYLGSPDNLGTTSFYTPYNFTGQTVHVPLQTLDDYVRLQRVSRVDVIKLDVEGAETSVLRGAEGVLASYPTIIVEFEETNQKRSGSTCDALASALTSRGYRLESLLGNERVPYRAEHTKQHYTFNVLATWGR